MLRVIFRPIKDSLKRVQSATKDRIKSQKERARIMKKELVIIGEFIDETLDETFARTQKEERDKLKNDFWNYVAGFWPLDPRPPGVQLGNMYRRIVDAAAGEAQRAVEEPSVNGASSH